MYNIKTLNKISAAGLSLLPTDRFSVGEHADPDGILVRSQDMTSYEFSGSLLAIARAGAGVNNIPVKKCSELGIIVFNTPGANANAVCELVLCSLFLASRDIVSGIKWVSSLQGDDVANLVEKGKSVFAGQEIAGKTLGVVGLGAIGVRVANAAVKLEMNVLGYDPYISVAAAWKLSRHAKNAHNLQTLYENCDYISLHLPMLDSTRGMINRDTIKTMKDGVRILNFARGELVNEEDIIAALNSGKVGRYITDFPSRAIVDAKNTVAVPHLGASTPESEENCANMAVAEIMDYLENGNIKNSVNFPDVALERSGTFRLCLVHKNIQGELNNILSLLSAENINVENMINKSKNEYAYTLMDLNTQVSESMLEKVRNIKDMIRLRTIEL
ncbi:MAG: 3-phosphoglycerate dehydrogenase [Deferribacteraceae bacterium]|jgi:D-3-phosphoglycerate dehydrogenase|nr:3-phosphoglycerate dehydrogenase [Deferribacteraceae bacterium]